MGLEDVVRALRARLQLIGVLTLVGLALAAGLAAITTPQYSATAQINLRGPASNGDPVGQVAAAQKVATFTEILGSELYAEAVLKSVGAALDVDDTPRELADRVSVTSVPTTTLLDISVTDSSATRAAALADAFGDGFDAYLESIDESNIRSLLTSRAEKPDSPTKPRLFLWLAIGGVLGLGLGVATALTRAALNRTIADGDELETAFGLLPLGVVPLDPRAKREPLPVAVPGTGARAEALRQLRTNLQFLAVGADAEAPRSLLVTSSVGGEGKTSTACNVAIALARAGLSTILVGADLRRPDLAGAMGVPADVGLTSVLAGWSTVEQALQPWGVDDEPLWVLAAGPTPPNPSEMLASEQMQTLLSDLESRADIVVVDGAPLLPVADSTALAAIVSGTLLVVAADRTRREQVSRALGILNGIGAHVYGGVLTMASSGRSAAESGGYLPPESRLV